MRSVIQQAILSHKKWINTLDHMLEYGKSNVSVQFIKSDRNCTLGKWLMKLEDKGKYKKIREAHSKFHRTAAAILKLAVENKLERVKKATRPGSRYQIQSKNLIKYLEKLEDDVIVI